MMRFSALLLVGSTLGCGAGSIGGDASSAEDGDTPADSSRADGGAHGGDGAAPGDARSVADAGSTADAGPPDAGPLPTPHLRSATEVCKLLSDLNTSDPTPNNVQFRANILGADLGIPVDFAGTLFFFFGDTVGFAGIWGGGQSHPDSVGYALESTAEVVADPTLLCHDLRFLTLSPSASLGPRVDARVQADFAGAFMIPPAGHDLPEYIHNPAGGGGTHFPQLPGDFEVPSGAFAYDGAIYIFYTTVDSPMNVTMMGSYLARWGAPSPGGSPGYDILYGVDQRWGGGGALGGNYINLSAVTSDAYVYLFGTGVYRRSPIHLARKRLDALASPDGFELYDAASRMWGPSSDGAGAPVVDVAGYGETSVRYFPSIRRWMFLAEEEFAGQIRIIARFAGQPEGPWSDAIVLHDLADPGFRAQYCCTPDDHCQGEQLFNCDHTGPYGSYLLPELQLHADGSFTVHYTLSSFNPYNVAIFSATFADF